MKLSTTKATLYTALNLLCFALIGTALLALTYDLTHEPIARSEEKEKLKLITQIAPAATYDNDIIKNSVTLPADDLLGSDEPTIAYLGRLKGKPSIAVLQVIAPDGYSGKIHLIVAIQSTDPEKGKQEKIKQEKGKPATGMKRTEKKGTSKKRTGRISGVRVISHKETPGLGDYIEIARNKWITSFNNTSLENPTDNHKGNHKDNQWKVKKDGGQFDYMAGATITPRAVVTAVHKALQYFAANQDQMFARPPL